MSPQHKFINRLMSTLILGCFVLTGYIATKPVPKSYFYFDATLVFMTCVIGFVGTILDVRETSQ